MSDAASLEERYRRLLTWYPRWFLAEHRDEMLTVLMAGSRPGQHRPGLADSASVIRSAVGMRLRRIGAGPRNQAWSDALAQFSMLAPVLLVMAYILEVAVPYRLPAQTLVYLGFGRAYSETGGQSLLSQPGFGIAVLGQLLVAVLVLLSLRWVALAVIAAAVAYWIVKSPWIPYPLQALSTSFYLLEASALIASPGARRGRHLMNWRHVLVLALIAAALQTSTLMYDAASRPYIFLYRPSIWGYVAVSLMLTLVAAVLAVVWKLNPYLLLPGLALLYPVALQLSPPSASGYLIVSPTPAHLVLLFLPAVLVASAAIATAVLPRRRAQLSIDSASIGPAG